MCSTVCFSALVDAVCLLEDLGNSAEGNLPHHSVRLAAGSTGTSYGAGQVARSACVTRRDG